MAFAFTKKILGFVCVCGGAVWLCLRRRNPRIFSVNAHAIMGLKNDRQPLLFESECPGEVGKLFCELRNTLTKASLFIWKDSTEFNKNNANLHSLQYLPSVRICIECSVVFDVSVKSGDDFFSYFVPMIKKRVINQFI